MVVVVVVVAVVVAVVDLVNYSEKKNEEATLDKLSDLFGDTFPPRRSNLKRITKKMNNVL